MQALQARTERTLGIGIKEGVVKALWKLTGTMATMALFAGCISPVGPHQAGGTVVGGATGAIVGGAVTHSAGGALIGGTIGALAGALAGKDVDDSLRTRVVQGQPLSLEDIKALAKANVGDDLIINQISATRTSYRLTTAQIIDLKNAGVSTKVIDFMISTPATAAQTAPAATVQPVPAGGYYYYVTPPAYPYPYYYSYPVYIGPGWYHYHGYH